MSVLYGIDMKKLHLIWLFFLALSCVRETPWEKSPEGEILFSVQDTKAQLMQDAASVAAAYGSSGIGLIAYAYTTGSPKMRYPSGEEAYDSFDYASRKAYKLTRSDNGVWHTDVHSLRWTREARYLQFFAFAPFDLPVTSGPYSPPVLSGLTIEDPATQEDILLADVPDYEAMPSVTSQKVPLVFFHPLAALEIRNGTSHPLTELKLRGVKDKASAYFFEDREWTLDGHTVTYSLADVPAGGVSQPYLLLPQELSGVTLTFLVNGSPVEARLTGSWEQGRLFTYTVGDRVWQYVLDLPETSLDLGFGATQHQIPLQSYKSDGYNLVQEDWTVSYYSDEACSQAIPRPSWLSVQGNAAAGTPGKESVLTITSIENNEGGVEQVQGNDAIRSAPEKGLWNLAHRDGTYGQFTESANCYIVNSPGWYALPLVMGNAIRGGNWNYPAFRNLYDYKGNLIVNDARLGGWTEHPTTHAGVRSGIPTSARVLWEDVDGLIYADANYVLPPAVSGTSSPIYGQIDPQSGNSLYQLFFYVPTWLERMKGSAVIGVFDADGLLMWSWHIWVTDYKPGQGDIAMGSAVFMPENIGEVRFVNQYPEHTVYVKVASAGNAAQSQVIRIVKAGGEGTQITRSYNPYFQHGRKDPFIPGTGSALEDLPVFGVNSRATRTEERSAIRSGGVPAQLTMAEAIQHPSWFGATSGNSYSLYWTAASHANFWNASTKTIYDPSPAGYHVPAREVLENLPANLDGLGIPFSNRRSSNPGGGNYPGQLVLNNNNPHAALWSADVDGANNAFYMRVQGNSHTVASIRGREGLSVRSVAENP